MTLSSDFSRVLKYGERESVRNDIFVAMYV